MQAYTGFAQVYDIFMDNVPYDDWTDYVAKLLKEHGVSDGLVLELGCGTGNITRRLADKGYDMIGIDNSEEMLEIAREYEYNNDEEYEYQESEIEEDVEDEQQDINLIEEIEKGHQDAILPDEMHEENQEDTEMDSAHNILYLQQDMRDFELYGTVAAVISICDSMNYITSENDLLTVFKLANNYLDKDGIFIFDMNTEYKYKYMLADNTIAENREDCSFIWDNYYDEDKKLNEYDVTIFVKVNEDENDESEQLFERFRETHYQMAYSSETVIRLLEEAGMEFVAVYDAFTHNPPNDKSERVYFIAKEKHQDNKKYI